MEVRIEKPRLHQGGWRSTKEEEEEVLWVRFVGGMKEEDRHPLPARVRVERSDETGQPKQQHMELFSREGTVSTYLGKFSVPVGGLVGDQRSPKSSQQGFRRFEEYVVRDGERVARVRGSVQRLRESSSAEGRAQDEAKSENACAAESSDVNRLTKALEAVLMAMASPMPRPCPPVSARGESSAAPAKQTSRRTRLGITEVGSDEDSRAPHPPVRTAFRGFSFEPRAGPIDWGRVASVNARRLERDGDLNVLESFLPDVAFGRVDFESMDVIQGHVRAFELTQLSNQYLLHSRELLRGRVMSLEKGIHALELQALADNSRERAARHRLHRLRRESRKQSKVIGTYRSLLSAHNPALAARTFVQDDGNLRVLSQAEVDAGAWLDDGLAVEGNPVLTEKLLSWRNRQAKGEEEDDGKGEEVDDTSDFRDNEGGDENQGTHPILPVSDYRDADDPGRVSSGNDQVRDRRSTKVQATIELSTERIQTRESTCIHPSSSVPPSTALRRRSLTSSHRRVVAASAAPAAPAPDAESSAIQTGHEGESPPLLSPLGHEESDLNSPDAHRAMASSTFGMTEVLEVLDLSD